MVYNESKMLKCYWLYCILLEKDVCHILYMYMFNCTSSKGLLIETDTPQNIINRIHIGLENYAWLLLHAITCRLIYVTC